MNAIKALWIAPAVIIAGCNVQTGLAPSETIIAKSADRDFGFTGTWLPEPNPKFPHQGDGTFQLQIEREIEYAAKVSDATGRNEGEFNVNFRTHEISPEHPHAVIEIELKNNEQITYRRLAIAAVKDDQLYLWMINGRKIAEPLFNDGVAAVIEHFTFSTTVRCDPKKLLDSISKNAKDILGDVQTFRRKKAEQGK